MRSRQGEEEKEASGQRSLPGQTGSKGSSPRVWLTSWHGSQTPNCKSVTFPDGSTSCAEAANSSWDRVPTVQGMKTKKQKTIKIAPAPKQKFYKRKVTETENYTRRFNGLHQLNIGQKKSSNPGDKPGKEKTLE